ncbi:hypothetical protein NL676_035177 [Syzygium grande]|nr:hypothetical protein NL676_035177 [Syzygium grande]
MAANLGCRPLIDARQGLSVAEDQQLWVYLGIRPVKFSLACFVELKISPPTKLRLPIQVLALLISVDNFANPRAAREG